VRLKAIVLHELLMPLRALALDAERRRRRAAEQASYGGGYGGAEPQWVPGRGLVQSGARAVASAATWGARRVTTWIGERGDARGERGDARGEGGDARGEGGDARGEGGDASGGFDAIVASALGVARDCAPSAAFLGELLTAAHAVELGAAEQRGAGGARAAPGDAADARRLSHVCRRFLVEIGLPAAAEAPEAAGSAALFDEAVAIVLGASTTRAPRGRRG